MLKLCSSILLLTDVDSFAKTFKVICMDCGVKLHVESDWNEHYRIKEDRVICGSKYLSKINKAYYPSVVLILKSTENFVEYAKEGVGHFIFDHTNSQELTFSLMQNDKVFIKSKDSSLKEILEDCNSTDFICGDYEFHFATNKFFYKKQGIYMNRSSASYLADWLLNGHKDNKKRMVIFKLRKQLGDNFLREFDRFGQIKEKKNEQ